jgi:sortase A
MRTSTVQLFQRTLLVAGIALLGASALAMIDRSVSSRHALATFDRVQASAPAPFDNTVPMAVLEVSRLHMRVPVFEGTDAEVLKRGAGWIAGTAKPEESGNIGIAGHRDSFFYGLKDIVAGDAIELETQGVRATYVVDQTEIVRPQQVEVLRPRAAPSITLVTCYPFNFIGAAPKRFIVHATLDQTTLSHAVRPSAPSKSQ